MNFLDVKQGAKKKNQKGSIIWLIPLSILILGVVWYFKAKHAKDKVVHKAEEVIQTSKDLTSKVSDKITTSGKGKDEQKEANKK